MFEEIGNVYIYGSNKNCRFVIENEDLYIDKPLLLNLKAKQVFISQSISLVLCLNGDLYHYGKSSLINKSLNINQKILNNVKYIYYVNKEYNYTDKYTYIDHKFMIYEDLNGNYYE